MIPIEALIFDMDGLLVDSEPLAAVAMQNFLARHDRKPDEEIQARILGRRLPEAVAFIAESYQIDQPYELLLQEYDQMRLDALHGKIQPMPGAKEILAFARQRHLRLALATSGQRHHAELSLLETGLAGNFEVEVTGADVEHGKPAPDLFLLAAAKLKVEPAKCVVFEDAPSGVMAAKAAGMRVVAVPNENSRVLHFPVDPDAVLPSLHAAVSWLLDHGVERASID